MQLLTSPHWTTYVTISKSHFHFLTCIFLILSLPAPQLPGSSLACSISINTQHLGGWRFLILLFGQMPLDSRLHDSQYLSRRAAEGPRTPCVLCSAHLAHSVPPWSQPPATRPHPGHLQPLYQADLKTHSQVNNKKMKERPSFQCCNNIDMPEFHLELQQNLVSSWLEKNKKPLFLMRWCFTHLKEEVNSDITVTVTASLSLS